MPLFRPKTTAKDAFAASVKNRTVLTGREITFGEEEVIVSKTDTTGHIVYANPTFLRVSGYTERELIGAPHSILRHPHMPACVFRYVWQTLESGGEVFGFVLNRTKSGDAYWVFAHLSPTLGEDGKTVIGYHSNRRTPRAESIAAIRPVYAALLAEEAKHANRAAGIEAGLNLLVSTIASTGLPYEEFIFTI